MTASLARAVKQMATPGNPAAGTSLLYPKSDGKWYSRHGTGAEVPVDASSPFTPNRIGLRGPSTDTTIFNGFYNSFINMSVAYSSGDMTWSGGSNNYLTIPTAGVYTFTFSAIYNTNTARRQTTLETWTGAYVNNGTARVFAIDDRYLGGYATTTLRATEPMAAGQFVRPIMWMDAGSNNGPLGSFMPTRFDVRRIL